MSKADLSLPLLPNHYYHIFNRGNEKRNIFFEYKNYQYFLKRYADYTSAYLDTYSYCLLDNHFHLLIKPKSTNEIFQAASVDFGILDASFYDRYVLAWLKQIGVVERTADLTVLKEMLNLMLTHPDATPLSASSDHPTHMDQLEFTSQLCSYLVSERLRRFMLSYAKSINKQQDRTGSLFQKPFRRKHVFGIKDLKKVSTYIHHNVIHHDYAYTFGAYPWSSYRSIVSEKETSLNKSELLSWFGGMDEFIHYSEQYKKHKWQKELFYIEES